MLKQPIESITLDDIQKLIDSEIQEVKTIEYKRDLYRLDAADHEFQKKQYKELLKDVSSFANTVGGHLILGLEGGIVKCCVLEELRESGVSCCRSPKLQRPDAGTRTRHEQDYNRPTRHSSGLPTRSGSAGLSPAIQRSQPPR